MFAAPFSQDRAFTPTVVAQAAMELTPDQKARIVENRRRLLISLEKLLRRQNSAVEVLQTSMPLEVPPHASQCC